MRIRGVTKEYCAAHDEIERGRPITPSEFDGGRLVADARLGHRRQALRRLDPLDKIITLNGAHFRVVGVAAKKGSVFGDRRTSSSYAARRRFSGCSVAPVA